MLRQASRESGTGWRTSESGSGCPEQGRGSPLSRATSPRGISKSGQAGSAGLLGLQNSLQKPPGLGQDSLLELGIPREEGSIDLHGQKGQFRTGRGGAASIPLQLTIRNLFILFTHN